MDDLMKLLNFTAPGFLAELDRAGYAIVPKYPTYEMVMQGLHPAIPGSVTEMYCEMIKAAPKVLP